MAIKYVRNGAAGAGTGADWANAYTTLSAALSAAAAGDTIYVSEDHSETTVGAVTLTSPGTAALPCKILCVNHAGTVPPVSADLRATALVATSGANSLVINGSHYTYGITFQVGSAANAANLQCISSGAATWQMYESCGLKLNNTASTSRIFVNTSNQPQAVVLWKNTVLTFGSTSQGMGRVCGKLVWFGSSSALAGSAPTTMFTDAAATTTGNVLIDGVDLSLLASGSTIFAAQSTTSAQLLANVINCKLGASVTVAATPPARTNAPNELQISDSGTQNYRNEIYAYQGALTTETVIIPSSTGATDGTTPFTWKIVTTANPTWYDPFATFPYAEWCDNPGLAITRTFELVNDGATLTNADIWAEVQYLGSALTPIASIGTTGTADVLATGANLTTSTATWTTTGLASPTKQKIAVTFTPNMKGYFRVVFKVGLASKTVYLNPRPNEV